MGGTVGGIPKVFAERLRQAQNDDGGFGPRRGLPSEPESTALATLALDDGGGRAWLRARQTSDGAVQFDAGLVMNDSSTALAALALGAGEARDRAVDHVASSLARSTPSTAAVPHDESVRGWAWTEGTFGWVEPTSRGILALRLLRPDAPAIADGVGLLRDRESVGGGWNYGNRIVYGESLPPFAQTTAAALIALQGADRELEVRGRTVLRRLWRDERDGGLSLAQATAALRLHRDPDARAAASALLDLVGRSSLLDDVLTLAWASIATGPSLSLLEVRP